MRRSGCRLKSRAVFIIDSRADWSLFLVDWPMLDCLQVTGSREGDYLHGRKLDRSLCGAVECVVLQNARIRILTASELREGGLLGHSIRSPGMCVICSRTTHG